MAPQSLAVLPGANFVKSDRAYIKILRNSGPGAALLVRVRRIKKNVGKFCSVFHVPIEEPV